MTAVLQPYLLISVTPTLYLDAVLQHLFSFKLCTVASPAMGGASDEFPLLAAYNLYAADINGDGKFPPSLARLSILEIVKLTRPAVFQGIAYLMPCPTRYMVTRMITTRLGRG